MTWPWWMFWCWKVFYCMCGYFEFRAAVLCSTQLATQKFAIVLCPHSSASSFRRFSSSKWWCETSHSAFWVLFVVRASQLSAQWEVWMTDRSQWNVSGPLNKTDTKKTTKNQNIFLDYTTNSNWHSNCLLVGGPDLEIYIYYYLFVLVIWKQFSKLQNYFDTSTQAVTFRLHSEFHPWLWSLVKNGVHKEINPGVKTINSYGIIFDYMIFLFITNFNEVKPLRRDD